MTIQVGRAPTSPWRLSAPEWIHVFKRAFKSFLEDDCMGLSAQVAFSSLLAFFPAMIFLVGLLDLVGAYDTLQDFLAPVAPGEVLDTIDNAPGGHLEEHLRRRVRRRRGGRDLGRERRRERRDQVRQPRLRPRRDPAILEDAPDRDLSGRSSPGSSWRDSCS